MRERKTKKNLAKSLEDYVVSSIYEYPSLYCKNTFSESRLHVLNHLFLVLGNGISYNPALKNFNNDNDIVGPEIKSRILAGEKLSTVYTTFRLGLEGYAFHDYDSEDKRREVFTVDLNKEVPHYIKWGHKIPKGLDTEGLCLVMSHPNDLPKDKFSPYPFSLEYTVFWDRENNSFIPKELILDDWVQGIIDIYEVSRDWFDSNKWEQDNYYNWSKDIDSFSSAHFVKAFNSCKSIPKLCKDYGIPVKNYTSVQDMADAIVLHNRNKLISDCEKVLSFYK